MKKDRDLQEITESKNQLRLFGYDVHFKSFIKLFNNSKLPNTILLTGPKGSGKSTFIYHFINYLLSLNESQRYSVEDFSIDPQNKTYLNICNNTHPNFHLLENNSNEEIIKIEYVKNILKFLSKSTYNSNIKIVMIDNAEYLNISSANALLKVLEEPSDNTFFFIVHNNSSKIPNTIKSRCVEFKYSFSLIEKKKILSKILNAYNFNFSLENLDSLFYYQSHGAILRYISVIRGMDTNDSNDRISCISYLIDKYKKKKDPLLMNFISMQVEIFYSELSFKNTRNLTSYFYNKYNLLKQINDVKKYNLDKNNFFISLLGTLKNETQ